MGVGPGGPRVQPWAFVRFRVAHPRPENQRLHSRDPSLFSDFPVFSTRILCSTLTFSFYGLVLSFLPGAARRAVPEAGKLAERLPDGGNQTVRRRGMGTDASGEGFLGAGCVRTFGPNDSRTPGTAWRNLTGEGAMAMILQEV